MLLLKLISNAHANTNGKSSPFSFISLMSKTNSSTNSNANSHSGAYNLNYNYK